MWLRSAWGIQLLSPLFRDFFKPLPFTNSRYRHQKICTIDPFLEQIAFFYRLFFLSLEYHLFMDFLAHHIIYSFLFWGFLPGDGRQLSQVREPLLNACLVNFNVQVSFFKDRNGEARCPVRQPAMGFINASASFLDDFTVLNMRLFF